MPVIPERAMYRNNTQRGPRLHRHHRPGQRLLPGGGATGYDVGFTTYVLVQNPNDSPTDVTVTYMTGIRTGGRPLLPDARQLAERP